MAAADQTAAPPRWDMDSDIVVLGTGAAGLSAALAAAVGGARIVVLEKTAVIGGTTAMSGGGTWVPNNAKMRAAGFADSEADALAYIRAMMPEGWRRHYNTVRPHSSLHYRPPAPEALQWPAAQPGPASPATPALQPRPTRH